MHRAVLALVGLCLLLTACASDRSLVVRAVFDDVFDLVAGNGVRLADVPVGRVAKIEVSPDNRALVTMVVAPGLELPARLSAELRQTGVLGERYVRLVPDRSRGGRFVSGGLVADTKVTSGVEDLVRSGNELLAAVAVDKVAGAIKAGGTGLGGRGQPLDSLLDDLGRVVDRYDANSADLVRLIDGLAQLLSQVGPEAGLSGQALGELARVSTVLDDEDTRLLDTLADIRALSRTGTDLIDEHRRRIDAEIMRLDTIGRELAARDADLARLPFELSKHNVNVIRGVNSEQVQILLDVIFCGINDTPDDPVRACADPPQGRPRPPLERPR